MSNERAVEQMTAEQFGQALAAAREEVETLRTAASAAGEVLRSTQAELTSAREKLEAATQRALSAEAADAAACEELALAVLARDAARSEAEARVSGMQRDLSALSSRVKVLTEVSQNARATLAWLFDEGHIDLHTWFPTHEEDQMHECPEDDTCRCEAAARFNDAMKRLDVALSATPTPPEPRALTTEEAEAEMKRLSEHFGERVSTASAFCHALNLWAQHGAAYHGVKREVSAVAMALSKSNFAARLVYGGEQLRTEKCPEHKGEQDTAMLCGLKRPMCPHGCHGTGWLPQKGDAAAGKIGAFAMAPLSPTPPPRDEGTDWLSECLQICSALGYQTAFGSRVEWAKKVRAEMDRLHAAPATEKPGQEGDGLLHDRVHVEGPFRPAKSVRVSAPAPEPKPLNLDVQSELGKPHEDKQRAGLHNLDNQPKPSAPVISRGLTKVCNCSRAKEGRAEHLPSCPLAPKPSCGGTKYTLNEGTPVHRYGGGCEVLAGLEASEAKAIGLDVVVDPTVPPGTAELRSGDQTAPFIEGVRQFWTTGSAPPAPSEPEKGARLELRPEVDDLIDDPAEKIEAGFAAAVAKRAASTPPLSDEEVEQIIRSVSCSGIDKPGSPAWRMRQDWLRARAALAAAKAEARREAFDRAWDFFDQWLIPDPGQRHQARREWDALRSSQSSKTGGDK